MSPTSPNPQVAADASSRARHRPRSSSTLHPAQYHGDTSRSSKEQPQPTGTSSDGAERPRQTHYTCFIRLPFKRHDFQDPPLVEWDAIKDKALWKLISQNSSSKDLDWGAVAERFDVSLPFLLQQAAWLSERHIEVLRKQMQRLGGSGQATPSTADATLNQSSSKETTARPPILTIKTSPSLPGEIPAAPGTPRVLQPPLSRTPSTTTVTQSRTSGISGKTSIQRAFRGASTSTKRPPPPTQPMESSTDADESAVGPEDPSDQEIESEEDSPVVARSQAFRRPFLTKQQSSGPFSSENGDDDEDSPGGYLPFAATSRTNKEDPSATLRGSPRKPNTQAASSSTRGKEAAKQAAVESSESSATSNQKSSGGKQRQPLSPQQRAQLASLSPRYRKEGSEGSPSMGSSFSDLDASVTQSALQEAFMSMEQHGGGSSTRMGSLGNVLKRMG